MNAKSRWDRYIEGATLLSYLSGGFLILFLWDRLPDRVPVYFNWPGKVDGTLPPIIYFETLALMAVISFALYRLSRMPDIFKASKASGADHPNYPEILRVRMLRTLNLAVAMTWLYLSLLSVYKAMAAHPAEDLPGVAFPVAVLIGIPLVYAFLTLRWKWRQLDGHSTRSGDQESQT